MDRTQRAPEDITVVGIVDDDRRIRDALERALKAENYQVVTASDGLQAMEIAHAVDVMILDLTMPNLGGIDVCQRLRSEGSELPILLRLRMDRCARHLYWSRQNHLLNQSEIQL